MKKGQWKGYAAAGAFALAVAAGGAVYGPEIAAQFGQDKGQTSEIKQATPLISEYSGQDNGRALLDDVIARSQNQTVFLMFYDPACPHCKRLTEHLGAAQSLTPLDYKVLRVNVREHPKASAAFKQENGVPETIVMYKGDVLVRWAGAHEDIQPLLGLMGQIQEHVATVKPNLLLPKPW